MVHVDAAGLRREDAFAQPTRGNGQEQEPEPAIPNPHPCQAEAEEGVAAFFLCPKCGCVMDTADEFKEHMRVSHSPLLKRLAEKVFGL